jgi:hypothetical protein
MSNYMPVSLLTFSNIFEGVIYYRMQFHIHSNNSLAQKQHSFGTSSSTEMAAYNLANNTLTGYDNKLLVGWMTIL